MIEKKKTQGMGLKSQEMSKMDNGQVAYIFPGQGSQWVGMGKDLFVNSPAARATFDEADSALGFALTKLCFEGPEETLRQTVNAQPAILAVSIAYLRDSLQLEKVPAFVAGHSLGEYTSLVAAQSLDFAEAIRLARERGRLMQEAGEKVAGGMSAIIGLEEAVIDEICHQSDTSKANINSPGQIAISGSLAALSKAEELSRAKGARRVVRLQVSGAFHSPLMRPAAEGMSKAISTTVFRNPVVPIVANTTAGVITTAEEIKDELLNQLCHCVQWVRSIEYMVNNGVSTFIEIGPGQVLTGLTKRINSQVKTINIGQ